MVLWSTLGLPSSGDPLRHPFPPGTENTPEYHQYLIVGAGPAGISRDTAD
jgi:hypothetical protein